jgi:NAD(P)-dependent dehydrogenase (short-subunit alcohol dehydrogenase family)
MDVRNQAALVTGGASGLGLAMARALIGGGAKVAVLDLPGERLDQAARELGALGLACDVGDAEAAEEAVAKAREANGPARVLVNCAGIATGQRIVGRGGPMPLDAFERVIRVNLIGTFNLLRLAAAEMAELEPNEEGERGVIINTASVAAFEGQIGQAAYSASKGGVAALTLPAARELARSGVRVVTIAPGLLETPMLGGMPDKVRESLIATTVFPKRLGRPEEYAALVLHIVDNPLLNGATLRLDGAVRLSPQ